MEKLVFYHQNMEFGIIIIYKDYDLIKGFQYPSIIHYVLYKPYKYDNYKLNTKFVNIWLYYAQKTNEYKNIIKYYNFKLLK